MTSSRLPGKVILPILGKPALELLIERIKRSKYLDGVCIATTTNSADDVLAALAEKLGVRSYRGSENDVLGRVLGAARSCNADTIVEITGDCPFVDPALIDRGIEEFYTTEVDYASNTLDTTYPNGFDVQVFPTRVLADVAMRTQDPMDRTHVSYYIYRHPKLYRLHRWDAPSEEHGPELRVTLDEETDYQVLQKIAGALAREKPEFSAADVVAYLRAHPEVVALNANVRQKEAHEL